MMAKACFIRLEDRRADQAEFQRTTISQQNDHPHHQLRVAAKSVEDFPFARRKDLSTHVAQIELVFLAMKVDVHFAHLTPCGAFNIWAKYLSWVHWHSLDL
jgi:hypothetical protein